MPDVLRLPSEPGPAGERWVDRFITTDQGHALRTVAYIRTPPGQGSPSGMHQHDFEQFYYILEGTLTLVIGDDAVDAPAGSLLSIPAGVWHMNVNRTDRDTVQLMVEARPQAG